MEINEITGKIIGCAIEVHKILGPGLLESAYKTCLAYELRQKHLAVKYEIALPLIYKEIRMDAGYRMDLFVEDKVVVEIKSVDRFTDVHTSQVLTYLKLSNAPIGLLINFNVPVLVKGIKRLIKTHSLPC